HPPTQTLYDLSSLSFWMGNTGHQQLVLEHMNSSEPLSAGLKVLPDKISSFASTHAAWRFHANGSASLPILQDPLTAAT
ncbi:MAG: hypothetical protein PHR16_17390, partial [Methylovulum sp.]|nr:hypothetical protein [Methylovulum sp.]